MAIVKAKPTSPGRRGVVQVKHSHLHKGAPYAGLVEKKSKPAGVTTQAGSPRVIAVADTNNITA